MLSTTNIQSIRDGTWELPCMEMELSKNDGSASHCGTGIIRRDPAGVFRFLLMSPVEEGPMMVAMGQHLPLRPESFLLSDDDYWTLVAVDNNNRRWTAERLHRPSFSAGKYSGVIIQGAIDCLSYELDMSATIEEFDKRKGKEKKAQPNSSVTLFSFSRIDLPATDVVQDIRTVAGKEIPGRSSLSAASVEMDRSSLTIEKFNGVVRVDWHCPGLQHEFDELERTGKLLSHALQFSFGRPMEWDIRCFVSGAYHKVEFISCSRRVARPRVGPPIAFGSPADNRKVWNVFNRYFSWETNVADDKNLAHRIWSVLHASTGSWDAERLTLCVEIEGLVHDWFLNKVSVPGEVEQVAKKVQSLIRREKKSGGNLADLPPKAVNKVSEIIGKLKSTSSAMTVLRLLAEQGIVRDDDVAAWNALRHPGAHGGGGGVVDEEQYGLRGCLVVLLYHLVFGIISYSGPFTDYGDPNYPTIESS